MGVFKIVKAFSIMPNKTAVRNGKWSKKLVELFRLFFLVDIAAV
jgi:hypothetical protein